MICAAPKGMVFGPFWPENGYFGLESGMVFELREHNYEIFIVSIPNE